VAGALALIIVFTHHDNTDSTTARHSQRFTTTSSAPITFPTAPAAPPLSSATATSPPAQAADAQFSVGLATLATLPVKGRAPKTGYDRSMFGDAWTDDVTVDGGHNGCDTRNDILRRDLVAVEIEPGSNGCAVLSGTLHDPYTDTTVDFQRGEGTSSQVQIDHVVALADAWQKGAQQWDADKRRNFANDPINLQATIGSINQQKGDGDAATWLPPNKSYRCTYVSRIVDIKAAYELWVTQAEHDAIARILSNCGAPAAAPEPATTPSGDVPAATTEPPPAVAPPAPEATSEYVPPPPAPAPGTGPSVYYPNCKAAPAAGAAPLYRGQPGYRPGLDGDGDGVACER
jgi:hypothetical protein